ncbi:hypothetical protein TNCV_1711511 [Trichonephila clavipes]|nr:hypothetical protein TNCV_1711511 [Trichonephila clavipes]
MGFRPEDLGTPSSEYPQSGFIYRPAVSYVNSVILDKNELGANCSLKTITHDSKCSLKKSGVGNNCFGDVIPHPSSIYEASFAIIDHASWEYCVLVSERNYILPGKSRINIKYFVKLKKSASKIFPILIEAYRDEILSSSHVFEWLIRFSGGRDCVEDDERAGRTSLSQVAVILGRGPSGALRN